MMADHGTPCSGKEVNYCMNGGACYKIPSVDTLSCVCKENNKGSRCEYIELPSKLINAREAGLIAAVVVVALLIFVVLALVIFYVRRMMKAKKQSRQKIQQQYWKVKPRV